MEMLFHALSNFTTLKIVLRCFSFQFCADFYCSLIMEVIKYVPIYLSGYQCLQGLDPYVDIARDKVVVTFPGFCSSWLRWWLFKSILLRLETGNFGLFGWHREFWECRCLRYSKLSHASIPFLWRRWEVLDSFSSGGIYIWYWWRWFVPSSPRPTSSYGFML